MAFDAKSLQLANKIGANSVLDLCLHVPKGYSNTALIQNLNNDINTGVVEIEVQHTSSGFGAKSFLKIYAYMPKFDENIDMIVFYAKPYHKSLFSMGSRHFVQGKIEKKGGSYSMTQPKIVKNTNTITPIFKPGILSQAKMLELTQNNINIQTLLKSKLDEKSATFINTIFHPTQEFINQYAINNALPKEYLDAIKLVEIYIYLRRLKNKKIDFAAKYQCDGDYMSFVESLPFSLTNGQKNAIEEIRQDLNSPIAARRLIMGDVGCGKTIVILCAALMAYPRKSILMAPTTILATQIYNEAKKFLPSYMGVELVTAASKSTKIANQSTHFIIGTQALLHRDLELDNLALVMSDEQHRFGTMQRNKLEKIQTEDSNKGLKPHVLQFSATPIPRTMAMINSHFIKHTFIKDMPFEKSIDCKIIIKNDFKLLLEHIKNEINLGHQSIIVYPLVEESENINYLSIKEGVGFWKKNFDKVYVTSGKDKEKESVIDEFRENGNILLATTVIEVGISLPKLSTIVIVAPERLGLATLHQLRGRVARNGLKGYCYLYTNLESQNESLKRLEDFITTSNGFEIAELDLKYRNSGDLLSGERQSGAEFEYFDMGSDIEILQKANQILDA